MALLTGMESIRVIHTERFILDKKKKQAKNRHKHGKYKKPSSSPFLAEGRIMKQQTMNYQSQDGIQWEDNPNLEDDWLLGYDCSPLWTPTSPPWTPRSDESGW